MSPFLRFKDSASLNKCIIDIHTGCFFMTSGDHPYIWTINSVFCQLSSCKPWFFFELSIQEIPQLILFPKWACTCFYHALFSHNEAKRKGTCVLKIRNYCKIRQNMPNLRITLFKQIHLSKKSDWSHLWKQVCLKAHTWKKITWEAGQK